MTLEEMAIEIRKMRAKVDEATRVAEDAYADLIEKQAAKAEAIREEQMAMAVFYSSVRETYGL